MCHGEEGIKPLFDTFFEVDAELIEKQEKKEAEERANTLVELLEQETEEKAEMKDLNNFVVNMLQIEES